MNIVVFGGFLGSGKTTVLMQLAEYLTKKSESSVSTPVVILENEVSDMGIDNQFLSRKGYTVTNIFSGCICCTVSSGLKESVRMIRNNWNPEWLLIEATGLAYPDSIVRILSDTESVDRVYVISIADANRWKRVEHAMHEFAVSQMSCADLILINKTDLADAETIDYVKQKLQQINSDAKQFCISGSGR